MNILVTGATGRVGSRLVPHLLKQGHSVRTLVRQPQRAQALQEHGAEILVGDLLQPETYTHAVADTDAIIHLAAFFRGATPAQTHAVNLDGTLALARAGLRAGCARFIFTSTNLVYGPGNSIPFQEKDSPKAATPYPKTKAAAERALMELHRTEGLGLRILRLAFVYGESDPHLVESMRLFRNWNPLQKIHMVHHTDVAQAILLATETQGIDGQIFNVADDEPVTAAEIMQLHNEPIAPEAANRPIDASWLQIVDTTKIREQLGFRPLYPALQSTVRAGAL